MEGNLWDSLPTQRARRVVYCVMVVMLLGCGSQSAAEPGWPTARPGAVVLSWDQNQQVRELAVDARIEVRLTGQSCSPTAVPVGSDAAVLVREQAGAVGDASWARFRVVGHGTAKITSVNKYSCRSRPAPERPNRSFVVTIVGT